MVRGRKFFDPADAVVWAAAALLAALSGLGAGFVLWSILNGIGAPPLWRAGVYVAGLALAVVGPVRQRLGLRLLLLLAAVMLLLSYAFGATLFDPLLGG